MSCEMGSDNTYLSVEECQVSLSIDFMVPTSEAVGRVA